MLHKVALGSNGQAKNLLHRSHSPWVSQQQDLTAVPKRGSLNALASGHRDLGVHIEGRHGLVTVK